MRALLLAFVLVLIAGPAFAGPYSKGKAASPQWGEVERLAGEQKFQAALEATMKVLESARSRKDTRLETEALIRASQLEMGLHGYETAVKFLRESKWPDDKAARALMHLYYAHALVYYQNSYSWEIGQREKTAGHGDQLSPDLKTWTTQQIGQEASRAFDAAMMDEAVLAEPVPAFFRIAVAPNTFPAGVRPILRDVVVYLAVQHLANQQFWSATESNETYKLGFNRLATLGEGRRIAASAEGKHPLEKAASWLAEHSAFHSVRGNADAALEARYVLLEMLHGAASEESDRKAVREVLRNLQASGGRSPWWARGQALLAGFIRAEDRPGRLIDARREALAGREAFPASPGAEICASILFEIERPEYSELVMKSDGPGKRSLLVQYRNLRRLYFRAYRIDFEAKLRSGRGNNFAHVEQPELEALLAEKGKPEAEWSVELPETRDYTQHRFFVTPPSLPFGVYVIIGSMQPDFGKSANSLLAARTNVTGLVMSVMNGRSGSTEARVVDGESGKPAQGAELTLYQFDWRGSPKEVGSYRTGADGFARIPAPKEGNSYFLIGRARGQVVFDDSQLWFGRESEPSGVSAALLFTDRAIYRPQQKVHFKVVGYTGHTREGRFETAAAGSIVQVRLLDPNYQVVAEKNLKLGSFGSASGEFLVPAGKPLGAWQLQASPYQGNAQIKVEEYKRPTFEASLLEAPEPLRLNRKALLKGEARYYFGLPLTAGVVRWRVTRAEVMPWWWGFRGWWFPGGLRGPETVASGTAALGSDGSFRVEFTPEADERKAGQGISYNFQVEADVTDEGGETRSASRAFRLGFVTVEARISAEDSFFCAGLPAVVSAQLSDLDGKPLKGRGEFRLARLAGEAQLPAELPLEGGGRPGKEKDAFAGADDRRRARWETGFTWESVTGGFREAETVVEGKVDHDEKGLGRISLGALARPGVYRLTYRTKDAFGAPFEASRDFLVADARKETAADARKGNATDAPKGFSPIPLPLVVLSERGVRKVGETARFFVQSGLPDQPLTVEVYLAGKQVLRKAWAGGVLELPVGPEHRGGFTLVASGVRDHQRLRAEASVQVPWSDRQLQVEFSTFRDKIRPGAKESFRVTVKGAAKGAAEVLAYMYDRSLDLFAPHSYPDVLSLYPGRTGAPGEQVTLGPVSAYPFLYTLPHGPASPSFLPDRLEFYPSYGIGGPGSRFGFGGVMPMAAMAPGESAVMDMATDAMAEGGGAVRAKTLSAAGAPAAQAQKVKREAQGEKLNQLEQSSTQSRAAPSDESSGLRTNFSEQAFFAPHLLTDGHGSATIEFTAPESVTSWRVLAHAVTRDLRGGSVSREARTVKELMVRPYAPRFLREGDEAEIRVQVNNASNGSLSGELTFEIDDNSTQKSALGEFGLSGPQRKPFSVPKGGSVTLGFPVKAPKKVGDYAFTVTAKAKGGAFSDGERRPFPLLPSRMHLAQSRFVTLKGKDSKTLEFKDLAKGADASLLNEKLVVTVDAQLFYGVLQALPYLASYPYECVEQTLNRFLSTGIVTSVFAKYPSVAKMAKDFAARKTQLERFDEADANRRMSLEETPWLREAQGGREDGNLARVLDPEVAAAQRNEALAKLRKVQLPEGGFPWFQGGPPDKYMTLYLLLGFARAVEFKVDVPRDMVANGWGYIRRWLDAELSEMMAHDAGWETVTLVNFALSSYSEDQWTGGFFDDAYRKKLLNYSFKHWKAHSPLLKGYLALTLSRMDRKADAKLVWDSVMDSAKFSDELGTFWAREDRSWLWYNDEIETHAFALRTQMELNPKDKHNEGMVQWLFLNKKLNHWKSTRATAEVIYSLVHYLDQNAELGGREAVKVDLGTQQTEFVFDPEKYTGKKNQVVVPGEKVGAANAKVTVSKGTKGFAFASATWHFSTEKLPDEERGDFFQVSRKYFRRVHTGNGWQLEPLTEGTKIAVGDQLEVQISLRAKHEAEYVHLRDPRGAGFEPETLSSGWKWDLGISWYEETRDSGSNFFFSRLPVGEYTFRYRLRANMAGVFRVGPAAVQSMYAPEFNAYSTGAMLSVEPGKEK